MRILHIISSTNPQSGGPIEVIRQLAGVLAQQGCSTEVACVDAPQAQWLTALPFKVYALGPGRTRYNYAPLFWSWLKEHAPQYNAVIVHGLWQYTGFATRWALRGTSTPYFVFTHGMLDPWFKRTYPLKHLQKWVFWLAGEYWLVREARAVLFTCEQERILARKSFWLYRCNEAVVNAGITPITGDPQQQQQVFFARFPELRGKRLLLFLSRIHVKKGCDLLLEAFARVAARDQHLHLVMAGPDQMGWQARLQVQAQRLGIAERVTWTGMITAEVKWGAFRAAEAFVLPSHQENFGIAVVEALACGTPVLISDKVNVWYEIAQDGAGFVGPDTVMGTVETLERWLTLPAASRQMMKQKAEQCFAQHFEVHQAAQNLLAVLGPPPEH
ncbi:glycosyltransferase [Anthocerotibacter panamensis]|uniref:glycosyltransferase n=1 Tax=Anthocerotibacter panamensis TaxID=2857077 RepID=UPI001C405A2D|nr:glycosyltransferase [Anthocerotibacter panamensis]